MLGAASTWCLPDANRSRSTHLIVPVFARPIDERLSFAPSTH